ncbi:MAG: serine hydrolase [Rhizobiaceae bacterium MnEN-MB40S]|nr:MAG: serine hydrolase [Rhizobiaceae bacterium MnEN-MB40S]
MEPLSSAFPRFEDLLSAAIESGEIPGASTIVTWKGVDYGWHGGYRDRGEASSMREDTIFRIASITKTVTSIIAMHFVERGKLSLGEPVSRYFPQFENLSVGVETETPSGRVLKRVPAERPVLVHDLLRHTSGLTYGQFSDALIHKEYREFGMSDFDQTSGDLLDKLAELPLAYQPGSTFEYGMSTDVLGWLLELIADRSLDDLVQEIVAGPLSLETMGFWPTPDKIERIAQTQPDPVTGEIPVFGSRNFYEAGWVSGGHGLFASAADISRYARMLLAGGELDGTRIIGRKTLEWMTSDHLPRDVKFGLCLENLGALAPTPEMGQGFGLGFALRNRIGGNVLPGSVGDFFWAGISGCYFWIDPAEDLCAVLMMQAPPQRDVMRSSMRQAIYGHIA